MSGAEEIRVARASERAGRDAGSGCIPLVRIFFQAAAEEIPLGS